MEKMLSALLKREKGPNNITQLGARLGITEDYVRKLSDGKLKPGWRLAKAIEILYNKEEENDVKRTD